jgi:Zn-dependent protease with chaperone function
MFIYDPKKKSEFSAKLKWLFSTHPLLEERIEMLEKY